MRRNTRGRPSVRATAPGWASTSPIACSGRGRKTRKMSRRRIERLYAVTPEASDSDWLCERAQAVLAGGARVIQYRSKSEDLGLRREQVDCLLGLCRAHAALLIVNDDVALAREAGADGVHLGRTDM